MHCGHLSQEDGRRHSTDTDREKARRSMLDQLLKVLIMQKWAEARSIPLHLLLVDVKACFDRMKLDDVVYDVIEG